MADQSSSVKRNLFQLKKKKKNPPDDKVKSHFIAESSNYKSKELN